MNKVVMAYNEDLSPMSKFFSHTHTHTDSLPADHNDCTDYRFINSDNLTLTRIDRHTPG